MNSVAIVEEEVEGVQLHYLVIVVSNVLRRNSAVDHQTLGTQIHRLMKKYHKPVSAPLQEAAPEVTQESASETLTETASEIVPGAGAAPVAQ